MDGIDITLSEVVASAQEIRRANGDLNGVVKELQTQMRQLRGAWKSDAGNVISERFEALNRSFADYDRVVEDYAKFLDRTATNYEITEGHLNKGASQFV